MKTKIIKLSFDGPVHFGKGRLADAEITCDAATLFSALFIEALAAGCSEELLSAVNSGELSISDAFPYRNSTLYLPKPMLSPSSRDAGIADGDDQAAGDSRARKAAKKLKYVPADKLVAYCEGRFDFIAELEDFSVGKGGLRTKVAVAREKSEDAKPYHVGGFTFAPDCGIYFICCGSYDIAPLVSRLSVSGLGGKRSSGYGSFTYKIEEADLPLSGCERNGNLMLVSTALPREDELTDSLVCDARYLLVAKTGFVQSANYAETPRKKRDMYLFAPGSVFKEAFEGDVFNVDMSGNHPVYRYARALWLEV